MKYEFHEFAVIFPLMQGDEYAGLVADIRANGLNNPVVIFENKVLDGRNRYRACIEAGFEPHTKPFVGSRIDALRLVWSENFHRRHLGPSQAASVVVEHHGQLECEIRAEAHARKVSRQITGGKVPALQNVVTPATPSERQSRSTDAQLAAAHGTNRTYVAAARKLKEERPEIFAKVLSGESTIPEVQRELKRDEHRAKVEKARNGTTKTDGPPSVVLADPPWRYDFSETQSREVENQYNTATPDEIISHRPITAAHAVCFMWATAPKLLEALRVLTVWGFDYKTHAIWDKQRDGMGYWFRGRHELLLVGVKGKFSPPVDTARVSSIFSEKRGDHSVKPECVYRWIEQAYPLEPKLEMYCRSPRIGWQVWGNET